MHGQAAAASLLIREPGDLCCSCNQISAPQRAWIHFAGCVLPPTRRGLQPTTTCRLHHRATLCTAAWCEHWRDSRNQGDPMPSNQGNEKAHHLPFGASKCKKEKQSRSWVGGGCLNTCGTGAQSPTTLAVACTKCWNTILPCTWGHKGGGDRVQVKGKVLCRSPTRQSHQPTWLGSYKAFFIHWEGLYKG